MRKRLSYHRGSHTCSVSSYLLPSAQCCLVAKEKNSWVTAGAAAGTARRDSWDCPAADHASRPAYSWSAAKCGLDELLGLMFSWMQGVKMGTEYSFWTEGPGGIQSVGLQRVVHNLVTIHNIILLGDRENSSKQKRKAWPTQGQFYTNNVLVLTWYYRPHWGEGKQVNTHTLGMIQWLQKIDFEEEFHLQF